MNNVRFRLTAFVSRHPAMLTVRCPVGSAVR